MLGCALCSIGQEHFLLYGGRTNNASMSLLPAGSSGEGSGVSALSDAFLLYDASCVSLFFNVWSTSLILSFLSLFIAANRRWSSIQTRGERPPPLEGAALAFLSEYVLLIGGFDGEAFLNDVFLLDLGVFCVCSSCALFQSLFLAVN